MTLKIKSDGIWRTVANGGLKIKSGGVWRPAATCSIKSGGVWRDSGYSGYPLPPTDIYIGNNSLSYVDVGFAGPGPGGAPVDHYTVQELYADGSAHRAWSSTSGVLSNIGVAENGAYEFRVRSVAPSGLTSGWYGPIAGRSRIQIGVSEQSHLQTRTATRPWNASVGFMPPYGMHRDEAAYFTIASSVMITSRRFVFGLSWPGGTYISWDTGNRQVYYYNNSAQADLMLLQGHDVDFTNNDHVLAGGNNWGFIVKGAGWTPAGNNAQILNGAIYFGGDETYSYNETVITRPYRGNALY